MQKIIKEVKSIHPVWQELEDANKRGMAFKHMFGKYHYIYTHKGKRISLIKLDQNYYHDEWEIYCLEGDLFEDVERYPTKKEAMDVIEKYLT